MMEQQEVAKDQTSENVQETTQEKTENSEFNPEEVIERLKQLEASKERLENESKKWKSRYKDLESTNEDAKRERLEQEGKYQELLELEKNRNAEYQKKMTDLKKAALQKELRAEIARHAKDAYDIDDIYKSIDPNDIEIDEESMSVAGVQEAVTRIRESKKYLFDTGKVPSTVGSRPQGQKPEVKTVTQMTKEEKLNALKGFF